MTDLMMKCGHAANAQGPTGPCCAICALLNPDALVVDTAPPDLTGRMATCCGARSTVPSSTSLAFFEYRGPGSDAATTHCRRCGFHKLTHADVTPMNPYTGRANDRNCPGFEAAGPDEHDHYYCGHSGWD
jgi:hypothetical protein